MHRHLDKISIQIKEATIVGIIPEMCVLIIKIQSISSLAGKKEIDDFINHGLRTWTNFKT